MVPAKKIREGRATEGKASERKILGMQDPFNPLQIVSSALSSIFCGAIG
jgi:hypothetical protein